MTALRHSRGKLATLVLGGAAAVLIGAFSPATSSAAPISCSGAALIAAIETANATAAPDTIELATACTYSYMAPYTSGSNAYDQWYGPSALPAIASDITIVGNGSTIERDSSAVAPFRLLFVGADPTSSDTLNYASPGAGSLTLQDLTLGGGLAKGGNSTGGGGGAGMGGAIFSQGEVSLLRTTLTANTAQGGNGGGGSTGGGGIGTDATGDAGGGFGTGGPFGGGSGGGVTGTAGGGGGGFRAGENGASGPATGAGGAGGGSATGTGGNGGGPSTGTGGNGSGAGGFGAATNAGSAGGAFGAGGAGSTLGGGGAGGVGGGGGRNGGGGGFGAGGGFGIGSGFANGGRGGFGGGGGGGSFGAGAGGFGGGAGQSAPFSFGGGGAGMGGAIFNHQGSLTIRNSTLSDNTADGGSGGTGGQGLGGAIFNLNGQAALDSATVASNTADQGGGALYNLGYLAADAGAPGGHTYIAQATLANSILADSTTGDDDVVTNAPSMVANGNANTVADAGDTTVNAAAKNLVELHSASGAATFTGSPETANPELGSLASNGGLTFTHPITDTSPAFNAGDTGLVTDQRGMGRPQGAADDIGAFELEVAGNPPPGPGGPRVPGPGPRTPVKPGPYTGPRKRVRSKIGGTSVSFTLPKNCVRRGATFGVRIDTKTPRRRRRQRARLTGVTFRLDAFTLKRDRRKPFDVTVDTTFLVAGSTHTLRSAVSARVARGKGKRPTTRRRTLKGSFRIC